MYLVFPDPYRERDHPVERPGMAVAKGMRGTKGAWDFQVVKLLITFS
jgi:hypothetical protein